MVAAHGAFSCGTWRFYLWHVNSQLCYVASSSLTRDQTQGWWGGAYSLSHWTTREVPQSSSLCRGYSQLPGGKRSTLSRGNSNSGLRASYWPQILAKQEVIHQSAASAPRRDGMLASCVVRVVGLTSRSGWMPR